MTSFLAIVFVFGIMIFFHELGHFATARLVGIRVLEFAMGMGPKLLQFKRGATVYTLRLLPIGGFVRMHGMDPNDQNVIAGPEEPDSYQNKTVGQRALVIAAGSIMNFVLAALLFIVIFTFIGMPESTNKNVIGDVIPNMPAATAGLQRGDVIQTINGHAVATWEDVFNRLNENGGKGIQLRVERAGQTHSLVLTPQFDANQQRHLIGILPPYEMKKISPIDALGYGFKYTYLKTQQILEALYLMFTGQVPAEVGGPVAIGQQITVAAKSGVADLLSLTAVLSINLGIINLFPIPALDGSHLVLLLFEKLRGRPLDPQKLVYIQLVGIVMLLSLMVFVTYKDITRLLGGNG